jgi:hypothetical protein
MTEWLEVIVVFGTGFLAGMLTMFIEIRDAPLREMLARHRRAVRRRRRRRQPL